MKRLLVVSSFFPPSRDIGGQRPLRLVRRIGDFGWEPYVLTRARRCQDHIDDSLGRDVLEGVHVEEVPCRSLWKHAEQWRQAPPNHRRLIAGGARLIAKVTSPLLPVDYIYPWAFAACPAGVSMVNRYSIDLIWVTVPWLTSMCLAHRISKRTGVPYVIDFRDVRGMCADSELPFRERLSLRIERAAIEKASGIMYVSPPQAESLRLRYPAVAKLPMELVYNWFEAPEMASCPPSSFHRPTILHGGSLYKGARRLDGFLMALGQVRAGQRDGGSSLQFVQYGGASDAAYLKQAGAEQGVVDGIETRDALPREQFLSACKGADILLLSVGRDFGFSQHAGAIPGKLYDYLGCCRPILVVGPRNCEAAKMVMRLNRGLAAADDAPAEIADAMKRLLAGQGVSSSLDLSTERVRDYEASGAMSHVAAFLDRVLARGRRGD